MEEATYQADDIRQAEERLGLIQNKFTQVQKRVNESAARFEKRNRVTTTTVFLMLSVAGLYDLIQFGLNFIPFVGWILSATVGIYAWLTFYLWTNILGWNSISLEKVTIWASKLKWAEKLKWVKWFVKYVTPVIAVIPVVNDLPEITLGVFLTILLVKSEDFVYNMSKGRVDAEIIDEGIAFFNLFREV